MPDNFGLQAALVFVGTALGSFLTWILQARKDGREATSAAIAALRATLEEQRSEIDRLAKRMTAATASEDRCLDRVRMLQQDMQAVCDALAKAGVAVPKLPSEAVPGSGD